MQNDHQQKFEQANMMTKWHKTSWQHLNFWLIKNYPWNVTSSGVEQLPQPRKQKDQMFSTIIVYTSLVETFK